jgi:hypothetical protein
MSEVPYLAAPLRSTIGLILRCRRCCDDDDEGRSRERERERRRLLIYSNQQGKQGCG